MAVTQAAMCVLVDQIKNHKCFDMCMSIQTSLQSGCEGMSGKGIGLHLDGILQLGVIQHDVKAAGAHGDQLPQDDVLTHPLHPVLLSKHGCPATVWPSTSQWDHCNTAAPNMHGNGTHQISTLQTNWLLRLE